MEGVWGKWEGEDGFFGGMCYLSGRKIVGIFASTRERMKHSEEDIIRGLEQGDEGCMRMVFDNYYRALCVYALRFLDAFEEAEDVVQEVLVAFWEGKRGKHFVGSVRHYLFGAVKNMALRRREEQGRLVLESVEEHVDSVMDDPMEMEEGEARVEKERLWREVGELPERTRKVFLAVVLEGLSYREAAERLGVTVNTVKTLYTRALKQLRERLEIIVVVLLEGSSFF